jgi:hypothetical protein
VSEQIEHTAGSSFEEDGQWHTPCSCGKSFTSATPSKAQFRQRKHAEDETPRDKTVRPAPVARAKVCGCGCGEPLAPKAGGLFRSGHDARFKSMLTEANAANEQMRHPLTGDLGVPMEIAAWLDERRGGGTFWQDKVQSGHKPAPERKPRPAKKANDPVAENQGVARAEKLMAALAARRPVAGETGVVELRSGARHGAKVVRRNDENSLQVQFLDGPSRGEKVIVLDGRFKKKGK